MEQVDNKSLDGQERIHNAKRLISRWLPLACLIILLAGYTVFLWYYYSPAISHPDSNGYWAQGTLIAQTGQATFRPESPVQYIGMHWLVTDDGLFVSRYSPGLPLAIALITKISGPESSVLLNPVLAVLTLLGVFLLTRSLIGSGWGVLAALVLALNPVFNTHALNSISHMAVAFLLVWGIYLLVCWVKHGRLLEAFGAGLLLGCIPAVRYPEAVFCLGIAVFLAWHWRARQRIWLHYLAAVGGALVPIIPLMIRNQLTFGAFWKTAYSITHEQTGFGWDYFQQHWLQYIQNLLGDGMGVMLPLGLIGIALMISLHRKVISDKESDPQSGILRPFGILIALIIIPSIILYMAYYWDGMGGAAGSLRFLLPLFPLFSVTAVWTLWFLTHQLNLTSRISAVSVVFLIYALWGIPTSQQECRTLQYQHQILTRATAALRKEVPAESVLIANQGLYQHLDFIRAWHLADPMQIARGGRQNPLMDAGNETPRPRQADKLKSLMAKYEGLSRQDLAQALAEDIRKWSDGGSIYFVGTETELQNMSDTYFKKQKYDIVEKIELPEAPKEMSTNRRGGGMRRPGDMARMPPPGAPPGMQDPQGPGRIFGNFRRGGGFPPGGGGMGMASLQGEKTLVIAKWEVTGSNSKSDNPAPLQANK
ncbi:MAG: hypothetical protein A2X48_19110 [Lentisphaerae bacterium GWF2_49_21]|nr:MAG: hypothetical protein A2X48_19110 [Lentisphaerae bacterium GWF2_49_21]